MNDLIGHNKPPLDVMLEAMSIDALLAEKFGSISRRVEDLKASLVRFAAETPDGIIDDETDARAVDLVRMTREAVQSIEERRVKLKAPLLRAGERVDGYAKRMSEPLEQGSLRTLDKIETRRRMREARDRAALEAEAARLQEEARAAMEVANAAAQEGADADAQEEARRDAEAYRQAAARAAAAAQAPVADLSRARTGTGGVSSLRSNWQAKVVNFTALLRAVLIGTSSQDLCPCCGAKVRDQTDWVSAPIGYIAVNESALKATARTQRQAARCPGVEFFDAKKGMTIR